MYMIKNLFFHNIPKVIDMRSVIMAIEHPFIKSTYEDRFTGELTIYVNSEDFRFIFIVFFVVVPYNKRPPLLFAEVIV